MRVVRVNDKQLVNELKAIAEHMKFEKKISVKAVEVISDASSCVKSVSGLKGDSSKAEKLEGVAAAFLVFPADPTGITYATGAVIYSMGRVIRVIERKNMGIRDVIKAYRRVGIELQELLRD